ncbi:MAG: hypothetical protein IPN08_12405 [Bacteroidales bacterium]|nr:hypothetical protein [Bacteroidales bacterium]MBK9358178.1 hypothetical protein [Bacteroidales bacterium]
MKFENNIPKLDLKSVLSTTAIIGVLSIIFLSVFIPTCDTRERKSDYYNSETKGVVYSIEKKRGLSQGRFGNRETTLGYHIHYFYEVNGKHYENIDYVYSMKLDETKFISYAYQNINNKVFIIRYASSKPEESFIVKSIDKNE